MPLQRTISYVVAAPASLFVLVMGMASHLIAIFLCVFVLTPFWFFVALNGNLQVGYDERQKTNNALRCAAASLAAAAIMFALLRWGPTTLFARI